MVLCPQDLLGLRVDRREREGWGDEGRGRGEEVKQSTNSNCH